MLSSTNRYERLLRLSNLISEHEKQEGVSRDMCTGCEMCDRIDLLESELGKVTENKTNLSNSIRERIKNMIRSGEKDATIVKDLNVSYNTVKTLRQVVKKEIGR